MPKNISKASFNAAAKKFLNAVESGDTVAVERALQRGVSLFLEDSSGNTPLHLAVKSKNIQMIELLMRHETPLNSENKKGHTPLMLAIDRGAEVLVIQTLLTGGANIHHVSSRMGTTPAHLAAEQARPDVLSLLIARGVNLAAADKQGDTPLHLAAESGDMQSVGLLITAGANPIARNKNQETPLFMAAQNGDVGCVRLLLEQPAVRKTINASVSMKDGYMPLHAAIENGFEKTAMLLMDAGADINKPDHENVTPLHHAVQQKNKRLVRELIKRGADVAKAPVRHVNGYTLLHGAVQSRSAEIVTMLAKAGADIKAEDSRGCTPLHNAVDCKNINIVDVLVRAGSDLNAVDNWGRRPLDVLCDSAYGTDSDLPIAELLVHNGAECGLSLSNILDKTPLQMALLHNKLDVVDYLIHKGAPVDETDRDMKWTAAFYAVDKNNIKALELLNARGADLSLKDDGDKTLLHVAVTGASEGLVSFLLEQRKIDIDAQDNIGSTALHEAVQSTEVDSIRLLLEHGARVDIKDSLGWTPLHYAVATNNRRVLEVLDTHSATRWDVLTTDDERETPLHIAARSDKKFCVEFLLEKNVDIHTPDKNGYTALEVAVRQGHGSVAMKLLAHPETTPDHLRKDGYHLMHLAAEKSQPALLAALLTAGADLHGKNRSGNTPLHIAIARGRSLNVDFLIQSGADIDRPNSEGKTPLDYAREFGDENMLKMVQEAHDQRRHQQPAANDAVSQQPTRIRKAPKP